MDWKPIWRRFCNHCGKEIPTKAVRKGAHFCETPCRQEDRGDKRIDEKARHGKKLSEAEFARVQVVLEAETRVSELMNVDDGRIRL